MVRLLSQSVSCSSATLDISGTDVLTNQSVIQSRVWRGRQSTEWLTLYPVNQAGVYNQLGEMSIELPRDHIGSSNRRS